MKNFAKILLLSFFLISLSCGKPQIERNVVFKEEINRLGLEYQDIFRIYKESLESSDYSNLLSPERLEKDKNQIEATLILNTVDSILNKYNGQRTRIFRKINRLTDSLKINSSTTADEMQKYKENIHFATTESKKNFIHDSTAHSINSQIIDLFKDGCHYEIQNEKMSFYTEDCLLNYTMLNTQLVLLNAKATINQIDKITKYNKL